MVDGVSIVAKLVPPTVIVLLIPPTKPIVPVIVTFPLVSMSKVDPAPKVHAGVVVANAMLPPPGAVRLSTDAVAAVVVNEANVCEFVPADFPRTPKVPPPRVRAEVALIRLVGVARLLKSRFSVPALTWVAATKPLDVIKLLVADWFKVQTPRPRAPCSISAVPVTVPVIVIPALPLKNPVPVPPSVRVLPAVKVTPPV